MKTQIFLLLVAFAGLCRADDLEDILPDPSWASLIESTSRGQLLSVGDDNSTCTAIFSCKDCNTAQVCRPNGNGGYELLQTVPCTSDRPFCEPSTGTCIPKEPDSCGANDNFVCLSNGRFPDTNCTKFHVCTNYKSMTFQCAISGETYNAHSQTCEQNVGCGTFDCTAYQGRKVGHSLYSGYFAYCRQENSALVIGSCPGNYELNTTSQICEPLCHSEGILQDVSDCHYYYKCTYVVVRESLAYMQRDRLKCPQGQGYSTKDFMCVDEKMIEHCIP